MVEKAELDSPEERRLRSIRHSFEGLPRVAERWERATRAGLADSDDVVADQVGFRDEWRNLMDRLEGLHRLYEGGTLSAEQQRQYEALLPRMEAMLPLIQRLQLATPPTAVSDAFAKLSVAERPAATR